MEVLVSILAGGSAVMVLIAVLLANHWAKKYPGL